MPYYLLALAAGATVVAAIRSLWSPCGLSMLSTITPMSERSRRHRFAATATWFVVGGVAGGATLGAVAAALAGLLALVHLPVVVRVGALVVGALVAVASDVRLFGFHLPLRPRQVDETWLGKYRPWVYGAGFGWQIGFGFATYVMTAAVYLVTLLAVLTAVPLVAFALCVLFGLVRGLAVFVGAHASTPDALRSIHRRLDRLEPASRGLAIAAEIVVGVGAAFAVWGLVGGVATAVACCLLAAGSLRLPSRRPTEVDGAALTPQTLVATRR